MMDWQKAIDKTQEKANDYEDFLLEKDEVQALEYHAESDIWGKDTLILSQKAKDLRFTSWAFSQLCTKLTIPCSYVKRCPVLLREQNINHWLETYDKRLLFRTLKSKEKIRAILSSRYMVLNDHQLLEMLHKRIGNSVELTGLSLADNMSSFAMRDRTPLDIKDLDVDIYIGVTVRNSEIGKLPFKGSLSVYKAGTSNRPIQSIKQNLNTSRRHIGQVNIAEDNFVFVNEVKNLVDLLPGFRTNAKEAIERALKGKPVRSELDKIKTKAEEIFGAVWVNETWPDLENDAGLTWFNLADLISVKASDANQPEMSQIRGSRMAGAILGI